MRLGATRRVRGLPTLHASRWSAAKVAMTRDVERVILHLERVERTPDVDAFLTVARAALANPEICPYTPELEREDQDVAAQRPLRLAWRVLDGQFSLEHPDDARDVLLKHFHPIPWPAFAGVNLWTLLLEVVPAGWSAAPTADVYREDRWLYDERAQQAAEALAARLRHEPDALHTPVEVSNQQTEVFEEYLARLSRGTNARRFLHESLKPPNRRGAGKAARSE